MKKQRYFWLGISMIVFGMAGCTVKESPTTLTPTPTEKIREIGFIAREEVEKKEENVTSEKTIITTEGLCEVLEATSNFGTTYNSFNRMIGAGDGMVGTSLFCIDERTGVIYFVNQGKDCFLYRIKEGEVDLAVSMPVKDIYPYEDSIYFMVDDYGKYELQEMHNGDIYCYTPESGAVELVYATDIIEELFDCHLYVEESGIYFRYIKNNGTVVENGEKSWFIEYLDYYLPFGEKEPVKDTKQMVSKGWGDYLFQYSSKLEVLSRTPKEDGTRETLEVSVKSPKFCVVGNVLYFIEEAKVVAMNLKTGEREEYDFLEALKKVETEEDIQRYQRLIESFVMTENALWATVLGGNSLYRMDLQSGEVTFGDIVYHNDSQGIITTLYTDGIELYGLHSSVHNSSKENIVHLVTEGMKDVENFGKFRGTVTAESLTE